MKILNGIGIALCLAVLCLLVAPNTKANELSNTTVVTFTVPVEVPGLSGQPLQPGTYLFKALYSSPDRDVIQISSQDGTHVFANLIGVPNSNLKAPDLITVMFTNRPAADPLALKAWYYPGRSWGDQIVYEKARATKLASESNEAVLSTSVVLAGSSVDVLKTAPIEAVNPAGDTVALAKVVEAPLVAVATLNVTPAPAIAATSNRTEGSTSAAASASATAPLASTQIAVKAEPTVVVAPVVAATPAAAIDPPATSARPASTDPAAASSPAPVVEPAVAPEVASSTLPQTASLLPLIGLVGLVLLGAGLLMAGLMGRRS